MSYKESLESFLDDFSRLFISELSERYSIEKEELEALWEETSVSKNSTSKRSSDEKKATKEKKGESSLLEKLSMQNGIPFLAKKAKIETDVDIETVYSVDQLFAMTKADLSKICKARGLKCSGNKPDLIERISGEVVPEESRKRKGGKSSNDEGKEGKERKEKKTKKTEKKKPEVLKKLENNVNFMSLRKNNFGNFEHLPTKLVIDRDEEVAIGTQEEDGTISELTDETIELSKKYNIRYKIPENLDSSLNIENVKIEGIDDLPSDSEHIFEIVDEDDDEEDDDENEGNEE